MREVRLYGRLARLFGAVHHFDVRSPAEAVQALKANFRDFEREFVGEDPQNTRYKVWSGVRRCTRDTLRMGGSGPIRIAPVLAGAGDGAPFEAILGAFLIALGYALSAAGYAVVGQPIASLGWALAVGGVVQMLMPQPKTDRTRDQQTSSYFDGPVQSAAQGNAVPAGYGQLHVGSVVISAAILIDQVEAMPCPVSGGGWAHVAQRLIDSSC